MSLEEFIAAVESELGRRLNEEQRNHAEFRFREGPTRSDPVLVASEIRNQSIGEFRPPGQQGRGPQAGSTGQIVAATGEPRPGEPGSGGVLSSEGGQVLEDLVDEYRTAGRNAGVPEEQIDLQIDQFISIIENDQTGRATQILPIQMQQQIAQWEQEAEALAPQPIGVPQGFTAAQEVTHRPGDIGLGGPGSHTRPIRPRYFEGDELNPAGLDGDTITRLQNQLIRAGLIDPDLVWMGVWDPASKEAYKTVLGMANQSGVTADDMVERLIASAPESVKDQRDRREQFAEFQSQDYLKPDKATLRQRVKDMFRSEVGRDPRPGELTQYVAELESDDRAAFNVEEDMRRSAFMRANFEDTRVGTAAQIALDAMLGSGPTARAQSDIPLIDMADAPPQTFQAVDPLARFQESFEQRYKPEIDRLASLDDIQQNRRAVMSSLTTLGSLIG